MQQIVTVEFSVAVLVIFGSKIKLVLVEMVSHY